MAETSEKVSPEGEEEETETPEEEKTELAEEDTSEKKTELDSVKATLAETQEALKRYKEKDSGHEEGVRKLQDKIKDLEVKIPPTQELPSELSPEDKQYREYLKKLGVYTKVEVEKMVQDRIAPFQQKEDARGKAEQKRVLDKFIANKPELAADKDIDGSKMQKVIAQLKRIAPLDPLSPNTSLEEDLELAHKWAFEGETNKEALQKAKAEGLAEGHEASETQVGEGASVKSPASKKQRTPEQEETLREFGVDDETLAKQKTEKK